MTRIALGHNVRCIVTEIAGKATVISTELNGNRRITVQQPVKDGALPDAYAHDEHEVRFVNEGISAEAVAIPSSPVELGRVYRDRVSGFVGTATHRHEYLSGCLRFTLTAETHEGRMARAFGRKPVPPETYAVSHDQLEATHPTSRAPEIDVPKTRTGGPLQRMARDKGMR